MLTALGCLTVCVWSFAVLFIISGKNPEMKQAQLGNHFVKVSMLEVKNVPSNDFFEDSELVLDSDLSLVTSLPNSMSYPALSEYLIEDIKQNGLKTTEVKQFKFPNAIAIDELLTVLKINP